MSGSMILGVVLVAITVGFVLGVLAAYVVGVFLLLTRGLPAPVTPSDRAPIARIKQPDGGWR